VEQTISKTNNNITTTTTTSSSIMGRNKQQQQSEQDTTNTQQPILHTVKFLSQKGNSVAKLLERYNLKRKNHTCYPLSVFALKYDMCKSPWSSPIVQECRGLVLENTSNNNYKVIAYPYKKFFNYNEQWAARIDWNTARVYDKLDGSLCTLYYYDNEWWVSSSGMPCASGYLESSHMKFCDLFWDIWKHKLKYQLPEDTTKCYMFEMVTHRHIIIVRPDSSDQERIVLHGVRCMKTFNEELPDEHAKKYGWECIKSYPLNSLEQVISASKTLDPVKAEGFIVCDATFNRVKIKSPQYVALAHLTGKPDAILGKLNRRSMLQIVRHHEGEEFLSYFTQYQELYNLTMQAYKQFITFATQTLEHFRSLGKDVVPHPKLILDKFLDQYHGIMDEQSLQYCKENKKMSRLLNNVSNALYQILKRVQTEENNSSGIDVQVMHYFSKESHCDSGEFFRIVFLQEVTAESLRGKDKKPKTRRDDDDDDNYDDQQDNDDNEDNEEEQEEEVSRSKRGKQTMKKEKNSRKKEKNNTSTSASNSSKKKNKRK
jgi:hypothetical protein